MNLVKYCKIKFLLILLFIFCYAGIAEIIKAEENDSLPEFIKISTVQFCSSDTVEVNVKRICEYIRDCRKEGSRVVVFHECSVTGYSSKKEWINNYSPKMLKSAEEKIQSVCKELDVYAIIGIPWFKDDVVYNTAVIISPKGEIIERYGKVYLAGEQWAVPGEHLSLFKIDGIPCTIIICHDERYPELTRIPVMMGAKIIFYISSESTVKQESKLIPYRAQIVARAVENNAWVVQSNEPAHPDLSGSHGQSRIIKPDGNIVAEAPIFEEVVLSHTLDVKSATRGIPKRSLNSKLLGDWWREGMKFVKEKD